MARSNRFKVYSTKESKQIKKELLERALEGETLNIDSLVEEFFNCNNKAQLFEARSQVLSWFNTIRTQIKKKYQRYFGSLDGEGTYGIADMKEKHEIFQRRQWRKVKALHETNQLIYNEGVRHKFMKPGKKVNVSLYKLKNGEEEKDAKKTS